MLAELWTDGPARLSCRRNSPVTTPLGDTLHQFANPSATGTIVVSHQELLARICGTKVLGDEAITPKTGLSRIVQFAGTLSRLGHWMM